MYYAVFFSLIINVLSLISSAWLLESSRPDFIRTSTLYPLRSIGQIVTLTLIHLFCGACVFPRPTGHLVIIRYFLPGETDAPKRKKPKVGEYDPKCERCEKTGVLCVPQPQGRSRACEACSKAKAKCSLSDGDSTAGLSGLAGAFQGLSDSVEEFLVEQRAQWEWKRKEKELHDGHVEKSFDNIEKLLGQQVLASQASAGALQHMARMLEAFVRRSSPDFMSAMPVGPPEYLPISSRWKKKKPADKEDKEEGGSGGKEKEKEGEGGDKEGEDTGPGGPAMT
ncbi:hypothetical protein B0H13DRAFT_2375879 [Mycena leptocephala]|nr:hypothetical protein B0H13DRAFT_2375879 [Mycena leptocephala]